MYSPAFLIAIRVILIGLSVSIPVEGLPPLVQVPPASNLAKKPPPGEVFDQDEEFNQAAYGNYVVQTFKSANVSVPRMNMMRPFTECDDGSYLFVTPRGEIVDHPTAGIYDARGSLIWTPQEDYREIYNFQMQKYKNEPHLVFWAGNNDGGHGDGHYYMYDKHYNLVRNISACNNLTADLHSFSITTSDTAVLTIYEKVKTDLAGVLQQASRFDRWMWDCLFQEIDLGTGEVIFQWRASEHFQLSESYIYYRPASKADPWDAFHINMVEKDALGNYLVSLRHMRCVAYVSGKTGEVLWRLGGKLNMFEDLSDGEATHFVGQHDAHWDGVGQHITLFDNRADWQDEAEHVSKGKRIEIDITNMTAKLTATYVHPENIFAFSQGSYQTLPNGNVLLGYGYTGALAEFSPNGTLLCDAYLQPSSRFSSGEVQSYQDLKFNWTGIPTALPNVVQENRTLYVSWLGSTEVRSWSLQDSLEADHDFGMVLEVLKSGFETTITFEHDLPLRRYLRLVALDIGHHELAASMAVDIGEMATVHAEDIDEEVQALKTEQRFHDLGAMLGFSIIIMVAAILVFLVRTRFLMVHEKWLSKRRGLDADALTSGTVGFWPHLMTRVRQWRATASYELLPASDTELHVTGH
ncbi:hypothetical protein DOTSEDRAFT_176803 [Dothistroma septosporum NZE10]|uniref:ASST-domain-containing protein n=1 Tax=Dothistroma septosporum (strain NZE10 / CBS 128990) TaxID=675120 RepID=N1PG30_DOTSN|nr:hypothetical protein DOTSEDRAFT_176803 [Dothistroma septosporum NZE10]